MFLQRLQNYVLLAYSLLYWLALIIIFDVLNFHTIVQLAFILLTIEPKLAKHAVLL